MPVTDLSTEEKALRRIHGNGKGWAFSARDFADLVSRPTVDSALHRLERKVKVRFGGQRRFVAGGMECVAPCKESALRLSRPAQGN
jgi:hypothetical protein